MVQQNGASPGGLAGITVELGVQERLLLMQALPLQGNILTVRQVRELRQLLEFNDAEVVEFGLKTCGEDGADLQWSSSRAVSMGLTPVFVKLIVETLVALDKRKELRVEHLGLFDQFVGTQ